MPLRLKIAHPQTAALHVYDDVALLGEGGVDLAERRAETIEVGNIELALPMNPAAGTLVERDVLGATSLETLPDDTAPGGHTADGYRAALFALDAGNERLVLDGLIYRDDCTYDDEDASLSFTIVGEAEKRFWMALDEVAVRSLYETQTALLDYVEIDLNSVGPTRTSPGRSFFTRLRLRRAYTIRSVVVALLAEAGISAVVPDPLYTFDVAYLDGGTERVITRPAQPRVYFERYWDQNRPVGLQPSQPRPDTLPPWTGREFLEAVQAMAGWTFRVAFGAFPSRDLSLTILTDSAVAGQALPEIDAHQTGRGFTLGTRGRAQQDFAVRTTNGIGEASTPIAWMIGEDAAHVLPPLPVFTYAADRWAIKKPGDAGTDSSSPDNETVRSVAFTLPQVVVGADGSSTAESGMVDTPDPSGHPNYSERTVVGRPLLEEGAQSVLLLITADVGGESFALAEREVLDPAPSQSRVVNEASARAAHANHQLSRSTLYELSATFALTAVDYGVGDADAGVRFRGEDWIIQEVTEDAEYGDTDLLLVRPSRPARPPSLPATLGYPRAVAVERLAPDIGDGDDFDIVSWLPPIAAECGVWKYELEEDAGAGWTATRTTRATAHVRLAPPAGVTYRVRAVAYDSTTSAWVYSEEGVVNAAPTFDSTPVRRVKATGDYLYAYAASDADADALTFTIVEAPAWLLPAPEGTGTGTTDNADGTGSLAGTAPNEPGTSYQVRLRVSDGPNQTEQAWILQVIGNQPPRFTSQPVESVATGGSYSYAVTGYDPDGDALTFTAQSIPAWMTLTDHEDNTATLAGTAPGTAGTEFVILKVSDGSIDEFQDFSVEVS